MEQQEKFKDRLEKAMKLRHMKAVDLHRKTGISESTISQYRSGYAEPKKQKLAVIASALDVDPSWLMGLDVSIEPDRKKITIPSAMEARLLMYYRSLTEMQKEAVVTMVEGMADKEKR